MLKILKRYVLKEVSAPFLLGIVFFTFVILTNQLFRQSEILIAYGLKWSVFGKLILNLLPSILTFIAPMAFLVAILIGYGRLASDNEILAMRAGGMSLGFIIRPMLWVALLLSLGLIAFNWTLLPRVNLRVIDTLYTLQFSALTNLRPGRFYDEFETKNIDLNLYFQNRITDGEPAGNYPGSDQTLSGVNLKVKTTTEQYLDQQAAESGRSTQRFRPVADPESGTPLVSDEHARQEISQMTQKKQEKETVVLVANNGKIEAITDQRAIRLTLNEGSLQMLDWGKPDENVVFHFDKFTKYFRPEIIDTADGQYVKGRKEMTVPELRRAMQDPVIRQADRNLFRNEFYQRFSLPFSCLAFALLGIPLAIIFRPSSKAYGFALSFALIMVYFMMLKWGTSMGKEGHPLAHIAIFSPNLVLGALGVALLMKARRM